MADVDIRTDTQKDLTTISVKGTLIADDLVNAINNFYTNPTRLVLWNANDCILGELSAIDLQNASRQIAKVKNGRPVGKTAFVIEQDNFGLGVLFEGFTKIEHLPYEYRTFTSEEEALRWLLETS